MKTLPRGLLAAFAVVALAACNSEPHPGVEIGNPDVDETSLRIVPEEGNEFYQIRLIDDATASVEQFQKNPAAPLLLDAVDSGYTRAGNNVVLAVSFSNDRNIGVSAALADGGQVQSVFIKVDGLPVESCFDDPNLDPSCDTSSSAAVVMDPAPAVREGDQAGLTQDPGPETSPAPSDEGGGEEDQGTEQNVMACMTPIVDATGTVSFVSCTAVPASGPRDTTTMLKAEPPFLQEPSDGFSLSVAPLFPN